MYRIEKYMTVHFNVNVKVAFESAQIYKLKYTFDWCRFWWALSHRFLLVLLIFYAHVVAYH